jgi:N-acyl-D-amino-acid deacylase
MSEQDVSAFLSYEQSMVGSDGLPCDPHPHPRLWGAFPRVLGHYSRDENVLSLGLAIHKMTALPSRRFNLLKRGKIAKGYFADLVLFDPQKIIDTASFNNPKSQALGIEKVWVNGVLSFVAQANEETIIKYGRAGRFLAREAKQ